MIKVASLIVTYNPKIYTLRENIESCLNQVNRIVIVDNGSNNIKEVEKLKNEYDDGIDLIKLSKNVGIAGAQNKGFYFLKNKGYEWILNLDQDSKVPLNLVSSFKSCNKLSKKTGIIAASYIDRNWSEKKKKELRKIKYTNIKKKKLVISSGNLVNVKAWYKVNGFDEQLFIDFVDFDFDTKLVMAGYNIYQINDVYIEHSIGSSINSRSFLSKILLLPDLATISDHSIMRQYYIYRNSMIFYKRYANLYKKNFLILRTIFATRRIFLYRNKIKKFKSAFKGIIDGVKYSPNDDFEFQEIMKAVGKRG